MVVNRQKATYLHIFILWELSCVSCAGHGKKILNIRCRGKRIRLIWSPQVAWESDMFFKRTHGKVIENSAPNFILSGCVPMDGSYFVFMRAYVLGDAVGGLKNRQLTRALCGCCGLLWNGSHATLAPVTTAGTLDRGSGHLGTLQPRAENFFFCVLPVTGERAPLPSCP